MTTLTVNPANSAAPSAQPPVVSREQWLAARLDLLAKEKDLRKHQDAVAAERRRLPMVRLDKPYAFEGPDGRRLGLADLFEGRRTLVVYHFMFDPADPPPGEGAPWSEGCPGCSFSADNLPHLSHLNAHGVTVAMISRAPIAKIAPFKRRMGWTVPWYSSFGSDFNYDFHTTTDEAVRPVEYNYKDQATLEREGRTYHVKGEQPALSVFLRGGDGAIYHTYSTYARGLEPLLTTYALLDLTPYGRGEDWEDSPAGWPQEPTMPGWVKHHDKYGDNSPAGCPACQEKTPK